MRIALACYASALLVSSAPAWAAGCHFDPYQFSWGIDTSTHMTVKSGTICGSTITFHGGGPTRMVVSQPASNGSASTPSTGRWEYQSKKGFVGKDAFVVEAVGESMGRRVYSGTTHINVDVDVVP